MQAVQPCLLRRRRRSHPAHQPGRQLLGRPRLAAELDRCRVSHPTLEAANRRASGRSRARLAAASPTVTRPSRARCGTDDTAPPRAPSGTSSRVARPLGAADDRRRGAASPKSMPSWWLRRAALGAARPDRTRASGARRGGGTDLSTTSRAFRSRPPKPPDGVIPRPTRAGEQCATRAGKGADSDDGGAPTW